MKKKSIFSLLLTGALLTGCAQTPAHTHTAGDWHCDLESHWQLCADCGEEMNKAAHTVANEQCSGCGAEVYFYEDDNTTEVALFNSYGDWSYSAVYEADGSLLQSSHAEYGYDESDRYTFVRQYEDSVMVYECLYTVNALGKHVPTEETFFRDGITSHTTYNEYGDWVEITDTASDGTVTSTNSAEYTYDAEGNRLTYYGYTNGVLDAEVIYSFTPDGQHFASSEIYTSEDGVRQVSRYDELGNAIEMLTFTPDGALEYGSYIDYNEDHSQYVETYYEGETLLSEYTYALTEDGGMTNLRAVNYDYDGSCSVYEYDLHGQETLEASYDAEGNVLTETRYENEYDANGSLTFRRTYVNGFLTDETDFISGSDEEGSWIQSGNSTTYHEDGSKTVYTYGEDDTWAEEITYDASGAVIDTLRYEYIYDAEGNSLGSQTYHNGVLTEEVQVLPEKNEEGVMVFSIYYNEDGTKTVYKYSDTFDFLGETVYDAAGNILSES